MITTKNILEERRSVPPIHISDETFNEKCFQQVQSACVWKREANNLFVKNYKNIPKLTRKTP